MRLIQATLTGYKSIPTSLHLYLRPDITCLIGANEHGKSNILAALNLMDGGAYDAYDRNANSTDSSHPSLSFTCSLSRSETQSLISALEQDAEAITSPAPGSTEEKTRALLSRTAAALTAVPSNIEIRVDNQAKRRLHLPTAIFPFSRGGATNLQTWATANVPRVVLFEPTAELADTVTLAELTARTNLPFVGLLKLAGVWEDRAALFSTDVNAHRLLDKAGKTLTKKVRRIWSQGARHTFRFDESGGRLHVSIQDPTTFDIPSHRSLGFRSFFSFFLTVYAQTDELDPEGFILLFDEPGIHLHPQGQKDLLRELRQLAQKNQIVYTTHSPFMIDRNDPTSTLLVRKGLTKNDKGTHIVYKPYGANWAPLTSALGLTPSDALFPPEKVLLVEGSSDRIYVTTYMRLCQQLTHADLNYFSILDADRRDEMDAYVRMLLAADRNVVVLADADKGGTDLHRHLARVAGAKKAKLVFLDLRQIIKFDKMVSLEDALPPDLWFSALEEYAREILDAPAPPDREAILAIAESQTLGSAAGVYLAETGVLPKPSKFSKTTVADLFARSELPVPAADSAIAAVCLAVTKALGIAAG